MKKNVLFVLMVSICLLLVLLISTITITNSKFIYNMSIEKLDLENRGDMSREEIEKNYSYIVDYILGKESSEEFVLPTLQYSTDGAVHFYEVKKLFDLAKIVLILLFISLVLLGMSYYSKFQSFKPFKTAGVVMMLLPSSIALIVSTNFNFFFTIFHKIFFNNDKWLFDPITDPIINILPEEFFALCAGLIVILTMVVGVVILVVFKLFLSENKKSNVKTLPVNI